MVIKKIKYTEIYEVWYKHLWPHRISPIEPNSAMVFLGGIDIKNMETVPTFFGYYIDNKLVGVNSGHKCSDNSYRSRGIFVFPEFRNQNIGTKLLLATITQGYEEKCTFIWSYPRKSSFNTYKSAGFTLVSDWEKSETSEANAYVSLTYS